MNKLSASLIALCAASGCSAEVDGGLDLEPAGPGRYEVASTNFEVADRFAGIGDDAMHEILLGLPSSTPSPFITDILKHPESAWVVNVPIPDTEDVYGPASGTTLPVAVFVVYPSAPDETKRHYAFPYFDARFGAFENMLLPDEAPGFADPDGRYPLVLLSHGASAHGIYDVAHAQKLASHGYIVAVLTYGDDRTAIPDRPNAHLSFLRPLLTKAVLDSLLESETFGAHIDGENIGIAGHSFGGFTSLAMAGGLFQDNPESVSDSRIKAAAVAAPWVGHRHGRKKVFAFGPDNRGLDRVTTPVLCAFGSSDDVTRASFILPAMQQLSGPSYVVELVDQPHVFEDASWQDRDAWELLFFNAYLKNDPPALERLRQGRSMNGGNEDVQLFDYQRPGD